MNTLKHYIECSLYNYPSLYSSRFEVLGHLFATLGNGVELQKDGSLVDGYPHPTELDNPEKHVFDDQYNCYMRFRFVEDDEDEQTIIAKATAEANKEVKKAMAWRETYQAEPRCLIMYPWNDKERFQPFRKYIGCTCPDFREQVEYFVKTVREASLDDITPQALYPDEKEEHLDWMAPESDIEEYRAKLAQWKDNIHLVEEALLK